MTAVKDAVVSTSTAIDISQILSDPDLKTLKINLEQVEEYESFCLPEFESQFYIELIMTAASGQIKIGSLGSANLEIVKFKNKPELDMTALQAFRVGFYDAWLSMIPEGHLSKMQDILLKVITVEDSLRIQLNGNDLAYLHFIKGLPKNEVAQETLAWIWIVPELDEVSRSQLHARIGATLRERDSQISLASYYRNLRSIKFHQKLGFKPACVRYTRYL